MGEMGGYASAGEDEFGHSVIAEEFGSTVG